MPRAKREESLTERELAVQELMRAGLTNEQIAERLGISLAGAKYHVSEILSKLGVASRQEATGWEPRRRWWSQLFGPAALMQLGLIAGAVVVLIGVGVLAWGVAGSGGTERVVPDEIDGPERLSWLPAPAGPVGSAEEATSRARQMMDAELSAGGIDKVEYASKSTMQQVIREWDGQSGMAKAMGGRMTLAKDVWEHVPQECGGGPCCGFPPCMMMALTDPDAPVWVVRMRGYMWVNLGSGGGQNAIDHGSCRRDGVVIDARTGEFLVQLLWTESTEQDGSCQYREPPTAAYLQSVLRP